MIVSGRVVFALIHRPANILGRRFYTIKLTDSERFACAEQPPVFDINGQPFSLTMEIPTGSEVRLHVEGRRLLAVQLVRMEIASAPLNPDS